MHEDYRREVFKLARKLNEYNVLSDELNEYLEWAHRNNELVDTNYIRKEVADKVEKEVKEWLRKRNDY